MPALIVKELTPSLRDDFLHFFDNIAFADNPDWSDCYCSAYHFTNNKGKAESRREASSLVEEDRMHGFLAYEGGNRVGGGTGVLRGANPEARGRCARVQASIDGAGPSAASVSELRLLSREAR